MTTYQRYSRIRKADVFDDTLTAASIAGVEGTAVDQEDFQHGLLSQFKRVIGGTDWYSAVQDIASDPRNLKTITDDVYYKRILRRRAVLNDVTVPAGVAATGTIVVVAGSALVDGETFTINDGYNTPTVFEFDSGGGVGGGNVAVPFTGGDSAATVKASVISAINGVTTALRVTASDGGGSTVNLTADFKGTASNNAVTDTVADGGFSTTGLSGGAGDKVTLSAASSETPSETAAVNAGSANGAVVATLSGDVVQVSLVEVAGLNAITPKNLLIIRDAVTFDPILDASGKEIMGLLQAETGVVDGDTFNDTTKQAQISFVVQNDAGNDLILAKGDDIGGKVVNYAYVGRNQLYNMNEQDFLTGVFQDPQSQAATTLQQAYIGGNTIDVLTAEGHLTFNLSQDLTEFRVQRGGSSFAYFKRDDTVGDSLTLDLDILDINNSQTADFLNGAAFDSGGQTINVGVTAGEIGSTTLVVKATTGDLTVYGTDDVLFRTTRETTPLPLDDATAGAISALPGGPFASVSAAIRAALLSADLNIYTQVLQNSYAQDANVPGSGNGNAQDWSPALSFATKSIDMNTPAGVDTIIVYNGAILFGGNGTTNNDVYVGTTAANGDLKYDFSKGVKNGDTVIAISWNAS